jgi:signal transduction histidine kinase
MAAETSRLRKHYKVWIALVAACLATLVAAALVLPKSFGLTALGDVTQCLLLLSGTVSLLPHAVRARGRLRLFWTLMTLGIGLWFCYQTLWVYYEVWMRCAVPDVFTGDIILFLHLVPLMAALALRPHAPQDEYAAKVRRLDFALLILWWVYLYVLFVIPWQYIIESTTPYISNLNTLYLIEKLVFLSMLVAAWVGSKGGWKRFYALLFGASLTYAASSYVANWALGRHIYYTGSLYDIPLAAAMAWITVLGLTTQEREPLAGVRSTSTLHGVWLARLGMIATFSLPVFAAWSLLDVALPLRIRSFRLVLTLGTAIPMGVMVFVRQRLLDRELLRLLTHSQDSFANLKRLQTQITESEKLASIGHLVGGAAHELNNPIAALLGYSDLLQLSKPLNAEQSELAAKIGQLARRTKSLVASLLGFATPSPAMLAPVDIKILLRTAIKLSQSEWQTLKTEFHVQFSEGPLLVRGDSNQLLQLCTQILNDALRAIDQRSHPSLLVYAQTKDGFAIIEIADSKDAIDEKNSQNTSGPVLSNLGLSACQAILRQHHGRIFAERNSDSSILIRVEIPLISTTPERSIAEGSRQVWEAQPSA